MKNLKNLGEALNKNEQKTVNGGWIPDLSSACGFVVFNSVESQCLSLGNAYQPQWNPVNNTCSALGQCEELLPLC